MAKLSTVILKGTHRKQAVVAQFDRLAPEGWHLSLTVGETSELYDIDDKWCKPCWSVVLKYLDKPVEKRRRKPGVAPKPLAVFGSKQQPLVKITAAEINKAGGCRKHREWKLFCGCMRHPENRKPVLIDRVWYWKTTTNGETP